MSYIGIDIGTSGCKASVIGQDGTVLISASREYSFISPQPRWAELDPTTVWKAVCETLKCLSSRSKEVTLLAIASIGESVVITDSNDNILYNAITYIDSRCEETVAIIDSIIPLSRMYDITGLPPNQMYSLNKLLWFKMHKPEILEKAKKIFLLGEYIGYLLTGERLLDQASASRTMLMDIHTFTWSEKLMTAFNIDGDYFAPIAHTGAIIGKLSSLRANELGLPLGINLILGGHDGPCSMLGAGALNNGDALLVEGSTEGICIVTDHNNLTESLNGKGIAIEPYFNNMAIVSTGQLTHGTCITWFAKLMHEQLEMFRTDHNETLYMIADRICAESSESLYFIPYLSGIDPNDPSNNALGAFVGLTITADTKQLYRALLEGLCFETRNRLNLLQRSGIHTKMLTAVGGATRSSLLMQLKADILGCPVNIMQIKESGIQGLGMICSVANRDYKDYKESQPNFCRIGKVYIPNKNYDDQFEEYKIIAQNMHNLYGSFLNKKASLYRILCKRQGS
jgi:xylulokinase